MIVVDYGGPGAVLNSAASRLLEAGSKPPQ